MCSTKRVTKRYPQKNAPHKAGGAIHWWGTPVWSVAKSNSSRNTIVPTLGVEGISYPLTRKKQTNDKSEKCTRFIEPSTGVSPSIAKCNFAASGERSAVVCWVLQKKNERQRVNVKYKVRTVKLFRNNKYELLVTYCRGGLWSGGVSQPQRHSCFSAANIAVGYVFA